MTKHSLPGAPTVSPRAIASHCVAARDRPETTYGGGPPRTVEHPDLQWEGTRSLDRPCPLFFTCAFSSRFRAVPKFLNS
jgi:hypothetical protein